MSRYRVNNHGKKIGSLELFERNVKRILPYAVLISGIGVGSFVIKDHLVNKNNDNNIKTSNDSISYYDSNNYSGSYDIEYFTKYGDSAYDLAASYMHGNNFNAGAREIYYVNDITNGILPANKLIILPGVPESKLSQFGYTVDKSYETKLDFVLDHIKNGEVLESDEYKTFIKDYNRFEELKNMDNNFYNNNYLETLLDKLIDDIYNCYNDRYIGKAVKVDELNKGNIDDEENKYGLEYKVKSGDTLSGIVSSYTDSSDYQDAYDDTIKVNGIDPDNLRAGETIIIEGVKDDDLEKLGYSNNPIDFDPSVELESRISYLKSKKDELTPINEEINGYSELVDTQEKIFDLVNSYDDNKDIKDLLYEARNLCDKVEKLTGDKYIFTPHVKTR